MTEMEARINQETNILRWFILLLLVMAICAALGGYMIQERNRAFDNTERAKHWTLLEVNQTRIQSMILKNHDAILRVEGKLNQCGQCHSPKGKFK